jgi:nickel transport protein
MSNKRYLSLIFAFLMVLNTIGFAYAHGVEGEYRFFLEDGVVKIEIQAAFDSGEPMSGAQVAIFAPNDLINPWQTGTCDERGSYVFAPDLSIPGTWDVQVRSAGHGEMIHIEVAGDEAERLKVDPPQAGEVEDTAQANSDQRAIVISGEPGSQVAPLVQIVISGGQVEVKSGDTPTSVEVADTPMSGAGYTSGQIIVMAVCVIWGFVGTALFFARRRRG